MAGLPVALSHAREVKGLNRTLVTCGIYGNDCHPVEPAPHGAHSRAALAIEAGTGFGTRLLVELALNLRPV